MSTQATGSLQIVGRGLDTVILNIYPTDEEGNVIQQHLPEYLEQELDWYKERAQEADEEVPTRWVFEGGNLFMKDKGGAPFKWILTCPQFTLAIGRGIKVAVIGQVRLSAEYLWQWNHHSEKGISDVLLFLTDIFGLNIAFQPAEVDIAVDFMGWDIGSTCFKQHFVYRSVKTDEFPSRASTEHAETFVNGPEQVFDRWKRITGLPFGVRTSAVSCLIYDKTDEIKYERPEKRWFHDLWRANGWDGEAPVWRVEFRFKRQALHEFALENIYDVLEHLPDLWTYAAGHPAGGADGLPDGWLRYVVPSTDTNRSRWPVHPLWQVIQGAFVASAGVIEQDTSVQDESRAAGCAAVNAAPLAASAVPVALDLRPFIRQRKREVSMLRALAAIAGYASTVAAWRGGYADERTQEEPEVEPDLAQTFHFIVTNVQDYLDNKGRDFNKLVRKKRVLYRLEAAAA